MGPIQEFFTQPLGSTILNLVVAILILIVGYIVARIIASVTRRLLKRTNLDNRLAESLSEPDQPRKFNVENIKLFRVVIIKIGRRHKRMSLYVMTLKTFHTNS